MIEQLYPRDWHLYAMSPHGDLVCDFADWIVQRGYSRICSRLYVRSFRDVLQGNDVRRDASGRIGTSTVDMWFLPSAQDATCRATRRAVMKYLAARSLLAADIATSPLDALVEEFKTFLTNVRGLSPTTVGHHVQTIGRLIERACPDLGRLSNLTQCDIERFIQVIGTNLCRHSLQHTVAHLRSFLRFCADHGYTKNRLGVFDTPRVYRGELPPRALNWSVVRKLLRSIDRSTVEGRRDFAILHLMAHYGLRPSEVAGLTVDAIDWDQSSLHIKQCKTNSTMLLPLSSQAKLAIGHYLHRGRPASPWKEIFLKVRCPADPIKAATIGDIYAKRVRLSRLQITGSSPYSLRHSFAMRLLEKGVGVKTIGDVLGHRSLESTCVYLRLHVDALRVVALPVPRAGHARTREAS